MQILLAINDQSIGQRIYGVIKGGIKNVTVKQTDSLTQLKSFMEILDTEFLVVDKIYHMSNDFKEHHEAAAFTIVIDCTVNYEEVKPYENYFVISYHSNKFETDLINLLINLARGISCSWNPLVLKEKGIYFCIDQRKILYLIKVDRMSAIYLEDGKRIESKLSLTKLQHMLSRRLFCEINKGVIIQINKVVKVNVKNKTVKLEAVDEELPVSRRCLTKIKQGLENMTVEARKTTDYA